MPAWVGWSLVALGGIERIIGWGGSVDFILARWNEPAWVGSVMMWILEASNVIGFCLLIAGIALLIRAERRRSDALYGVQAQTAVKPNEPSGSVTHQSKAATPKPASPGDEHVSHNLWVGKVEPFFEEMHNQGHFSLAVSVINFGTEDVFLKSISGRIKARFRGQDGKISPEELPLLKTQERHDMLERFPPRHHGTLLLFQHISSGQAERIFDAAMHGSGLTLDLRDVRLNFAHNSNPDNREVVELWQGLRLRGGSQIASAETSFSS